MPNDSATGLSRGDFLRASASGAAGLGLAALAAAGCSSSSPPAETSEGYVVVVTHGHADPTRAMLALFSATRLPAADNHVWFAIDGGELCKKGEAEKVTSPLFKKQGNAAELLAQIRGQGTAIHI